MFLLWFCLSVLWRNVSFILYFLIILVIWQILCLLAKVPFAFWPWNLWLRHLSELLMNDKGWKPGHRGLCSFRNRFCGLESWSEVTQAVRAVWKHKCLYGLHSQEMKHVRQELTQIHSLRGSKRQILETFTYVDAVKRFPGFQLVCVELIHTCSSFMKVVWALAEERKENAVWLQRS